MKKIISTIAMVLVGALSTQAQDNKQAQVAAAIPITEQTQIDNSKQDTKKQAYELVSKLGLDEKYIEEFYNLLSMKQEIMSKPEYSQERRTVFMESFKEKLKASLDPKSYEKLLANKDLYKSLMAVPIADKK